jgi:hypothetical protein
MINIPLRIKKEQVSIEIIIEHNLSSLKLLMFSKIDLSYEFILEFSILYILITDKVGVFKYFKFNKALLFFQIV